MPRHHLKLILGWTIKYTNSRLGQPRNARLKITLLKTNLVKKIENRLNETKQNK